MMLSWQSPEVKEGAAVGMGGTGQGGVLDAEHTVSIPSAQKDKSYPRAMSPLRTHAQTDASGSVANPPIFFSHPATGVSNGCPKSQPMSTVSNPFASFALQPQRNTICFWFRATESFFTSSVLRQNHFRPAVRMLREEPKCCSLTACTSLLITRECRHRDLAALHSSAEMTLLFVWGAGWQKPVGSLTVPRASSVPVLTNRKWKP